MSTPNHPRQADWHRAASFAARAHHGQLRKDGKTPYFAHPARVCLVLREVFNIDDPVALCAALLHDTLEDTCTDYDDLAAEFGNEVADTVACLTKDARLPEAQREAAYDQQLARGPWQARAIKLADAYDNLRDCLDHLMARKAAGKAQRALAVARGDAYLVPAAQALEALMHQLLQDA